MTDTVNPPVPRETAPPEIVTEGTGWHEQLADRAELDVGFTATGRDRVTAVRELAGRVSRAEPAFGVAGLVVRHRRVWVSNEWKGNRVVGCRAGEDVALRLDDVTGLENLLATLIGAEPATLNGPHWLLRDPTTARREAQHRAV
ncbi:MAG TPA: SIMPL domain-containing protein, partial [Pseudonocardia sp.]|nr:SIMPL domain-containing protein [Pseudonocardia sp.]